MHNKKFELLQNEYIEIKLHLECDVPKNEMPPMWNAYFSRHGPSGEGYLMYTMQTVKGVLVFDKMLLHIDVGKYGILAQKHLDRNKDRIFAELTRLGHVTRVHRIRSLRYFGDKNKGQLEVKCGEKGGYVQKMTNLSNNDTCWVTGAAIVCDDATVCDDAVIGGNALISSGVVYERAKVCGNVEMVGGNICGRSLVLGYTRIHNGDRICGDTIIGSCPTPPPTVIHTDAPLVVDNQFSKAQIFCQFPFKSDKPSIPKRRANYDESIDS